MKMKIEFETKSGVRKTYDEVTNFTKLSEIAILDDQYALYGQSIYEKHGNVLCNTKVDLKCLKIELIFE